MPELSKEEVEQFQKWQANKAARKVKSTSRRKALADLKAAHKPEYAALVKKYGG